jgi:hypothetical protein
MSTSRLTLAPVNLTGSSFGVWPFSFPGNAPSVPASTVNATNTNPWAIAVAITGGTLTAVTVNGVVVGAVAGTYFVPAGGTINVTYSVAPTWTWIAAGVDPGGATSDGSNFLTAWPQGALAGAGVQFPNLGTGLTYLMCYLGANACTASYLVGQKYGGDVFPFTQEQQVLTINSFNRLGPFSPNKYNQTDITQFASAPGGVIGASGQGLTCIDFSNCSTLLVRAYQVVPVNP